MSSLNDMKMFFMAPAYERCTEITCLRLHVCVRVGVHANKRKFVYKIVQWTSFPRAMTLVYYTFHLSAEICYCVDWNLTMLYHLLNTETTALLLVNICIVVASDGLWVFFFQFEIVPVPSLSLSPLSVSLCVSVSLCLSVKEEGERMGECV